jgi:hypothetical protein
MEIKAGQRLAFSGCATEMVVVRPPSGPVSVTCAGREAVDPGAASAGDPVEAGDDPVLVGKRYADEESGLELLCSKPGPGPLAADGRPMAIKGAKPLPSSD